MYNLDWKPKTKQGLLVKQEEITNISDYFNLFEKIPEFQIYDKLQENSSHILLCKRRVQRTTKSGKQPSFSVLIAVGNKQGCIGLAYGKSKQLRTAIMKGINNAKKKAIFLDASLVHKQVKQINFKNSRLSYKPGYKGMGIVAGQKVKQFLELAGITDVWVNIYGSMNPLNYTTGLFEILKEFKK